MCLVIGGGFSFGGPREWLNRNVFPVDHFALDELLGRLSTSDHFAVPVPGQTFVMSEGKVIAVEPKAPFIEVVEPQDWPSREFLGDVGWLQDYDPACGRKDFPETQLDALQTELSGLAGHLYGTELFRHLHSLTEKDLKGRKPTIALALLADAQGGAYVYEYMP